MKPVVFLTSARNDLRSEKSYYRKIAPELARRLQTAVEQAVQNMSQQPLLMEPKEFEVRRWPVGDGFPHGVLYRDNENKIIILSVFHPKRDPDIWQERART